MSIEYWELIENYNNDMDEKCMVDDNSEYDDVDDECWLFDTEWLLDIELVELGKIKIKKDCRDMQMQLHIVEYYSLL